MFGMETGGSLRLLSPETKLSLDSTAAALSGSVGSAVEWPPDSLSALSQSFPPGEVGGLPPTSAVHTAAGGWLYRRVAATRPLGRGAAGHPQNRTGIII